MRTKVSKKIIIQKSQCIHCGCCTSVCASGALKLNTDHCLEFSPEKCTFCSLCVKSCPLKLFCVN
ncbi:MAG: 4Fe-4S binding protein [Bacteroidetes bacterium]|nr:4Fe-4S binding protein [Bacteroidota bacterium]